MRDERFVSRWQRVYDCAVTQTDPVSEMMAAWKKAADDFLGTWAQAMEKAGATEEHRESLEQLRDTYLGTQANLVEARKRFAEPAVEMAGGVPIGEFRRLMDQVHTILLRLDRIDDELAALRADVRAKPRGSKKGS